MVIHDLHSWNVSPAAAKIIQLSLRNKIDMTSTIGPEQIRTVAAADISFTRYGKVLYAAVVISDFPSLQIHSIYTGTSGVTFPYVPGFLSFREVPPLLEIFRKISPAPDVLLCDGHGIAHPRGFGLASHLGLILDIPTIGCAKSVLVGDYKEPGMEKGCKSPLIYRDQQIGAALRTRRSVKPVFVSVGHKISLPNAMEIVLRCSPRYRIPEPLRFAHRKVNELRRQREKHEDSGG